MVDDGNKSPPAIPVNPLVTTLRGVRPASRPDDASPQAVPFSVVADGDAAYSGPESPERRSFVGYYGGEFRHRGVDWCVLYPRLGHAVLADNRARRRSRSQEDG